MPGLIEAGHWSFLCVPVTWCAAVNMVITPCAYSRPRDEILWRHAAMVEAGLSETGGGITGALGKAAWRVVPDPMSRLHHISAMHRLAARGCSGIFPGYSDAKRGASPLRLPACRAGQQCVSPPNCRPGPRSSRSGQCFPEAEQGGQAEGPPPLVLSCCCFLSWRLLRHQFENRDVRLVCHQLLGVGDHAPRTPGRACRGGSRAWPWQGFAVLSLANY